MCFQVCLFNFILLTNYFSVIITVFFLIFENRTFYHFFRVPSEPGKCIFQKFCPKVEAVFGPTRSNPKKEEVVIEFCIVSLKKSFPQPAKPQEFPIPMFIGSESGKLREILRAKAPVHTLTVSMLKTLDPFNIFLNKLLIIFNFLSNFY